MNPLDARYPVKENHCVQRNLHNTGRTPTFRRRVCKNQRLRNTRGYIRVKATKVDIDGTVTAGLRRWTVSRANHR